VIGAIADLDADVTLIEATRSRMEILDDLTAAGFANSVGPGVYDIHSPRVPTTGPLTAAAHRPQRPMRSLARRGEMHQSH
jgi:5-methyltetrahydropteroyltriglutamate--homocysteine methyltransferase